MICGMSGECTFLYNVFHFGDILKYLYQVCRVSSHYRGFPYVVSADSLLRFACRGWGGEEKQLAKRGDV